MAASEYVNLDLSYPETMKLIEAFKRQNALWDPHLADFHNRQAKEEAWQMVAVGSGVEVATCKKKIKSLMSSCRREKMRIINSRRSGNPKDVLEPQWRYWNVFKFLRGLEDDEEDPLGTAPEMDILDPTLDTFSVKAKVKKMKRKEKDDSSGKGDRANSTLSEGKCSVGKAIALKLRKMYPEQRRFAENLIYQTLYKGFLCQLTANTEIGYTVPQEQTPNVTDGGPQSSSSGSFLTKTEFVACQTIAASNVEYGRDSSDSSNYS